MLQFITASQRLSAQSDKTTLAVCGPAGIGKTYLAAELPPEETLFLDIEAGMKSIEGLFKGVHVPIRNWLDFEDVVCLVGGANPAVSNESKQPFCLDHYNHVVKQYGAFIDMSKIKYIFCDSISDATRLCGAWAESRPESWTIARAGKPSVPNTQGRYGLVGRRSVSALKHLQFSPAKTIIYVGKLEVHKDDEKKSEEWRFSTEGGMTRNEIPFIVDNVVTYDLFDYLAAVGQFIHNPGRGQLRAFVCKSPNPWGLPAKNRSGNLEMIEEPSLMKLLNKINAPGQLLRDTLTEMPR